MSTEPPRTVVKVLEGHSTEIFEACSQLLTKARIKKIVVESATSIVGKSKYPETTIRSISFQWYPVRRDPKGKFLPIHDWPKRPHYERTNAAGCGADDMKQRDEHGGHDLPCF
ncbi:hypothetical protein PG996_015935 [Apiospora saccharicola]|uniref:Uncharacterized protein n=1 Tax=Apiospora saccharicola TaxID=335842 RepID=A0ABR1TPU0_9PEZI